MSKFHTLYSHAKTAGFTFTEPSLTEQSFSYETDINNIVKRGIQSSLPVNNQIPVFNSRFSPDTYNTALNLIADAKSQFESLPSHIRQRFENNPRKLLEFVSDDKNRDEAIKLGFIDKPISDTIINTSKPLEVTTEPPKTVVKEASSL